MIGSRKLLDASEVAANLRKIAAFIQDADKLLSDTCCGATAELACRIEAVPGQGAVSFTLAAKLDCLGDDIQAEDEAAERARELAEQDAETLEAINEAAREVSAFEFSTPSQRHARAIERADR